MELPIFKYISFAGLLACIVLFSSCSDDELNSKELKIYIRAGVQNELEVKVLRSPIGNLGDSGIEFPILATRELTTDVHVSVSIDESLATGYNETHSTSYKLLPADMYTLTNTSVTLKKGEFRSEENIKLEFTDYSKLTDEDGYLIAITLKKINGKDKGLQLSTNYKTVYIVVNSSYTNIDTDASSVDGDLIPKNNWDAFATSALGDEVATNAIDGDNMTAWLGYYPSEFTVDMKETQYIKGLRITPDYIIFGLTHITAIEVYISTDGEEWQLQGSKQLTAPSDESKFDNPDYKYVKFYGAVSARYFRINVLSVHHDLANMAEIDAYK